MSGSTNAIVDGKQIKAAADYLMCLLKQLHLADQIVEIAQDLSQCGEGGTNTADEMLEQYKKCSEENKKCLAENKKCFEDYMKFLADYMKGLLEQKALADQIIKRANAGEITN